MNKRLFIFNFSSMKTYFLKSLVFIALFSGVVLMLILVLERKTSEGRYYQLPVNVTTLIAGHSRPGCAFNDTIIQAAFNISNVAEPYFFTWVKLRKILANNSNIKTLLIEFSDNNINSRLMNKWLYGDGSLMFQFPKYSSIMTMDEKLFLFKKSPVEYIRAMPLSMKNDLEFMMNRSGKAYVFKLMGSYGGKTGSFIESLKKTPIDSLRPIPDSVALLNLSYLDHIVDLCKTKNIRIFFTRAPVHPLFLSKNVENTYDSILNRRYPSIPVIDFSGYRLNDLDYCDFHHINYGGSVKVSRSMDSVLKLVSNMPASALQHQWRLKIER